MESTIESALADLQREVAYLKKLLKIQGDRIDNIADALFEFKKVTHG